MFTLPVRALGSQLFLIAATAASLLFLLTHLPPVSAPGEPVRVTGKETSSGPLRRIVGPYRAHAIRVVDGDTFEARLRIWFNQEVSVLIRLDGVDAPELRGRCDRETRLAAEARDTLAAILASGDVFVRDLLADKYNGRAVARASVTDPTGAFTDDVGALMAAGGYARPYDGRARAPWCGAAAVIAEGRRAR
jgi:endonuclease YncB( thermonuclease family)